MHRGNLKMGWGQYGGLTMSLDTQLWLLASRVLHEPNGHRSYLHHAAFQAVSGRKVAGQTWHVPAISSCPLF